jgi:hypothetical protein
MFIRLLSYGVLVVGVALSGTGCGPTAEAQQLSVVEEQQGGEFCGGFAGIACPEGYTCVDDPTDDCDPNQGGADCGGICQKEPKKPTCDDPNRIYISKNPEECATIRFYCEPNMVPFSDECGCGCEPASP